jgi:hypothetical protein
MGAGRIELSMDKLQRLSDSFSFRSEITLILFRQSAKVARVPWIDIRPSVRWRQPFSASLRLCNE